MKSKRRYKWKVIAGDFIWGQEHGDSNIYPNKKPVEKFRV
jgi:hypothetical protein